MPHSKASRITTIAVTNAALILFSTTYVTENLPAFAGPQPLPAAVEPSSVQINSSALPRSIEEAVTRKNYFGVYANNDDAKIFAVYLPWYGAEDNNWSHWNEFAHDPDGITAKDISSAQHPLTGLYDSSDLNLIRYHIDLAKAVGIDGYIVDWYGNTVSHDKYIQSILEEAEAKDFTISLLYEVRVAEGSRENLKKHFKYILDHYASSPAYQKVGGIPVIHLFGIASNPFKPEDYAAVAEELKEEGRRQDKIYVYSLVADSSQNPEYFKAANALYEWINMGAFNYRRDWNKDPHIWENTARKEAYKAANGRPDLLVAGSVYAGFDDEPLGGGNWGEGTRRFLDDQEGGVAQKTVDYVIQQRMKWAVVQTLNDWNEGTEFEPSLEKGFSRLWHLMKLTARMKGTVTRSQDVITLVENFTKKQMKGELNAEQIKVFETARQEASMVSEDIVKGVDEWRMNQDVSIAKIME